MQLVRRLRIQSQVRSLLTAIKTEATKNVPFVVLAASLTNILSRYRSSIYVDINAMLRSSIYSAFPFLKDHSSVHYNHLGML